MEIIGKGFFAGHLAALAGRHPDTVALAAGVSWAGASSPADFARETDLLTETAERCRRRGHRLLFLSTSSPSLYGIGPGAAREDRPAEPCDLYGAHKLALEDRLRASGADHLVLRLSSLAGPGQPAHQFLPTLTRLVRRRRVVVHRGASRDLIWVGDAVRLIDLLLTRDVRGETVNVATGTAVPVETIVGHLEARLGVTADREYLDGGTSRDVAVDKLRSLVPETAALGFGPDYFRTAVDAFLRSELSHA